MHPDYGMILTSKGALENQEMVFLDIPMDHITLLNGSAFTTLIIITQNHNKFAASFDFEMPFMTDLARLVPPVIKKYLLESITAMDRYPWNVDFPHPVRVGIRAHLGPIKKCEDEEFRPFIVDMLKEASPTPDEMPSDAD